MTSLRVTPDTLIANQAEKNFSSLSILPANVELNASAQAWPDGDLKRRHFAAQRDTFSSLDNPENRSTSCLVDTTRLGQQTSLIAKRKEVYRFKTNWLISSVAWSSEPDDNPQLALSSYVEEYANTVQLVSLHEELDKGEIQSVHQLEHPYPATKVLWIPRHPNCDWACQPKLIATTADYLRIWRIVNKCNTSISSRSDYFSQSVESYATSDSEVDVKLECLLNSNLGSRYCAPLTSFDWNELDSNLIVTSSVDATCAVWDLEMSRQSDSTTASAGAAPMVTSNLSTDSNCSIPVRTTSNSSRVSGSLKTQLLAHDDQVYDVSWSRLGRDIFVSSSGDGSVRMFDLRNLTTSTVLCDLNGDSSMTKSFAPPRSRALVRVACSKQNSNLIATFTIDSNEILVLDTRFPGQPIAVLNNHTANLNGISWAPHLPNHLCSGSDDGQALIWNLSNIPNSIDEPALAYRADGKINTIGWSAAHPDWIAIGFGNCLELLRV